MGQREIKKYNEMISKFERLKNQPGVFASIKKNGKKNKHKPVVSKSNGKKLRPNFKWREKVAKDLQADQRKKANRYEKKFQKILFELEINHTWQQPFYTKLRHVCVDFYLPDQNIVVEIDGSSHKNSSKADKNRSEYLTNGHGIKMVVRIKNEEVMFKFEETKLRFKNLIETL